MTERERWPHTRFIFGSSDPITCNEEKLPRTLSTMIWPPLLACLSLLSSLSLSLSLSPLSITYACREQLIVPARGPLDFGWDPIFEPTEGEGGKTHTLRNTQIPFILPLILAVIARERIWRLPLILAVIAR